ncbi:hypothetical protein MNBD_GAMMA01-566 [hydrothermal vent metagenome]|uniref:Fumarate reductase subunit D n=1 Tax=hydrothermal vent metagenome TaxID=652676 RepID=A0A3B0V7L9_9ZZZZ
MSKSYNIKYKVSNKPVIWSLFAAGGTIAALVLPVLVLLFTLAVPLSLLPQEIFSYARMQTALASSLVRLFLFTVVFLSLWHAAHRMRITLHDFGLRADSLVKYLLYGLAAIASIILGIVLFSA